MIKKRVILKSWRIQKCFNWSIHHKCEVAPIWTTIYHRCTFCDTPIPDIIKLAAKLKVEARITDWGY